MRIAILGFGSQGRSAYEYWRSPENEITVCDKNENTNVPEDAKAKLGDDYLVNLDEYDLLVRSPSVHPQDIVDANSPTILKNVTTNTNEFFKISPTRNIIGVTGTKGKGTTSTLVAKMIESSGQNVHLGGNIGIPPLDMLKKDIKKDDWVVLELANFQLIDLEYSPKIAVCLMVEPEHMDWHKSFEEYKTAKQQIFANQDSEDIAIYYEDNANSKEIANISQGMKQGYFGKTGAHIDGSVIKINDKPIIDIDAIKLLGNHNLQNVCAAITAFWNVSHDLQAIHWTLETFSGLEHRLEFVAEKDGIKFYDDSFGTTPQTAVVAIEAFEEPKVVILGGSDKKASYEKLAQTVANHNVRYAVLIGDTAAQIQRALEREGFTNIVNGGDNMKDIVSKTLDVAQKGDIILLSTGCASFGLFKNYKDRGEQFKKAVQELVLGVSR